MSYGAIAAMTKSDALLGRIAACAASEGIISADVWAIRARWAVCASPGWGDKWDYAVVDGRTDPGADNDVVTDGDILAAVAAVRAGHPELEVGL